MQAMMRMTRRRRKAQSLIEFALGGILLFMFLAAAIDFGRVYYTYIVVENMAGEGASYVSQSPDADKFLYPSLDLNETFQGRAINVATRIMGGVIDNHNVAPPSGGNRGDVTIVDASGNPLPASDRCLLDDFTLRVAYHMNDLFFPGILGFGQITITAVTDGKFIGTSGSCAP